jgi:serine/threonine protein kinase
MKLERIGKYQILGEIGRGTMGTVYKARDPILKRDVAIKTLAASPGKNDESRRRFEREAQAAALLAHPNIVTVHDFGEEQGLTYMAMELLEGQDLKDVIGTPKMAVLEDKLRVMEQIAAGLALAHGKGVVHRDLKPANIHLQPNGQVKLVDFGLARLDESDMTQTGVVLGTPNYMSPEQALGDRVDARTDVFSAGALFYELLTNRKPFDAETTPGVLYQVVHKQPVPIRQWTADVPPILVEVVERALAKDKNQRFQNGRQLRAALAVVRQALQAGRGETATLAGESQRASEAMRKNDSQPGGLPVLRASWVEGSAALDPRAAAPPLPRPVSSGRLAPTLSGRTPTHVETSGSGRRPRLSVPRRDAGSRRLWPSLALLALVAVAGGAVFFMRALFMPPSSSSSAAPSPDAARAQVGLLTAALVQTQLELAEKDLEDKNYAGAAAQADRVLKLVPGSSRAREILDEARRKKADLEAAASEARVAFEGGNLPAASQALARVLELDPKHPVGSELTARLNSTFRSQAEEAGRLVGRARTEAERARAQGSDVFSQAVATAAEGDALFRTSEFAESTRRFLQARDTFDRARREASAPVGKATPHADAPAATAVEVPSPQRAPSPPSSTSPVEVSAPARPAALPAALPVRHFVTGKSRVASARAGRDLAGFDSSDVKTQKIPDLLGRLDFEMKPEPAKAGDSYTVRVYLVNEGKKAARLKAIAFATSVNGRRTLAPGTLLERDVPAQQRVLVGEWPGLWSEGTASWSLEATVTSDHDETCAGRLLWQ